VALVIDITPGFSTEEMRMSEAGVIGGSGLRYWTVPVICRAFRSVGFDKNQVEMWLRKISVIAKNDTDSTYLAFAAMLENDFSAEQSLKLIADIAQSTSAFAIWQNPMGSSDPENAYAISVSTGQIYELIPEAIKTCRTFGFTADQTVEILGNKYFANAARWLNRFTIDSSYQHLSEILGVCKEKGLNIEEAYNLFTRVFALIDTKLKAIFHQIKGSASVSAFAYEIFTSMLPEAIKEAGDAGLTGEQLVTCTLALVEEKYRASL
jgi:hypothetical protein